MDKPYRMGLIVGRFQDFHNGHRRMIETALALCGRVGVFVGSSQESGTVNNPFDYRTRAGMLRAVFGDAVEVFPLPDIGVGNTALWGEYVLDRAAECFGELPDLLVSGREERRAEWLAGERGSHIAELYVPKTLDISASRMREFLIRGDRASWQSYTDPALWDMFDSLRAAVLSSQSHTETASV